MQAPWLGFVLNVSVHHILRLDASSIARSSILPFTQPAPIAVQLSGNFEPAELGQVVIPANATLTLTLGPQFTIGMQPKTLIMQKGKQL